MDTMTMDAAVARYQRETAKLARYQEIVREMNTSGDKSSKERKQMEVRLWKTQMFLRGMRSMAKAVGLDPSAL